MMATQVDIHVLRYDSWWVSCIHWYDLHDLHNVSHGKSHDTFPLLIALPGLGLDGLGLDVCIPSPTSPSYMYL